MAKTTALLFCYALTLSVLPSRIGAQRRGTFKIGVVSPMSGANAATGANFVSGLEWWRDQVNAAGGIQTRDGYRLTAALVLEDTQGNSTRAAAKVVDFFHGLPTHVDALVNTFTAHNIAINEAMATNSIRKVLMHCSGGTPGQYGDLALGIPRWPYQFARRRKGHWHSRLVLVLPQFHAIAPVARLIPTLSTLSPVLRFTNLRIAFIKNTVNPFTKYTCDQSVTRARAEGLVVDNAELFEFDGNVNPANEELLGGWIEQLKASGTRMLMGCTWLQDGLMLMRQIQGAMLELELNIILIAPTTAAWEQAFPRDTAGNSDGDFVLSPTQWHHTQRFQDQTSISSTSVFASAFRNSTGRWPDYLASSCTAAGSFLEAALGNVNWHVEEDTANTTTIGGCTEANGRDERLQVMVRDLSQETFYGDVRFDRHNQNIGHAAAVVQGLRGVGQSSVLPEVNSASQIYLPIPTWEARRGCPANRPVDNGFKCIASEHQTRSGLDAGWIAGIAVSCGVVAAVALALPQMTRRRAKRANLRHVLQTLNRTMSPTRLGHSSSLPALTAREVNKALYDAIQLHEYSTIPKLVQGGADPSQRNEFGQSPLAALVGPLQVKRLSTSAMDHVRNSVRALLE
eukprot:7391662-Prymnesium_polylepis.1